MKYRALFPPALTGLLIVSIFSTAKNNSEKVDNYNEYINQAREAASYEIYVDAETDYLKALEIKKVFLFTTNLQKFIWKITKRVRRKK